jgi:uncharacterized phiE125 gp8 family phage protein
MNYITPQSFRYEQTSTVDQYAIVSVAEAKFHAIIDNTADVLIDAATDDFVQLLINAAVERWISGTGVYPIRVDFTASLDFTPAVSDCWLKHSRISEVSKVYAIDADLSETVLSADEYTLDTVKSVVTSYDWPIGSKTFNNFCIDYTTGISDDAAGVPDDVKLAIKMMVTHWFENRQPYQNKPVNIVPEMADTIMRKYKARRL